MTATLLSRANSTAPFLPLQSPLEMWGGVECTCNRVDESYFDQMEFSGHAGRLCDYLSFARLGIKTLRTGLLWERYEAASSWRWFDERLQFLQELNIRPIAGLVHHGSGPRHTSLLDLEFPEKLARYAGSVAERYPWIDAYTPVNEPNTTARFSAMYGMWYPHHTSRNSYLRALLNQVRATVLSMEAIRRVRPDARLVQTDDLGRIFGQEALRTTWELLNLRQWLTFDLLCGRVDRDHPMFAYMRAGGIPEREIFWFMEHKCTPDVIGVNYYVTSDRYLDHRTGRYPPDRQSAEGAFVDVEAVRVSQASPLGVQAILEEAWKRYKLPVAITEVHLGCAVDEQIRWLAENWEAAMRARSKGVECVAITSWALLGSFFWNELVTSENGYYEPGAFDVRNGSPVPTQLADVIAQIAAGNPPRHAALARQGWWRSRDRICFPWGGDLAA